jgi:Tuberculosis necrotizing toxin/Protein of unknown function, DUF600
VTGDEPNRAGAGAAGGRDPDRLYALPGLRDPEGWLDSYYLLIANAGSWEVGVFERGGGRLGARFTTEDEACRWLLGELVFPEREPRLLSAEDEQRSRQRTEALIRAAMARADQAAATTGRHAAPYQLDPGLIVDHFGQESGSFLYADRTPFAQRSLPPSALNTTDPAFPYGYHRYEVMRPFTVHAGRTAPAFGQPGGGLQLKVEAEFLPERPPLATIRWLLRAGYLRRVAPAPEPVQAAPPPSEPAGPVELYRRIARVLAGSAPDGWVKVTTRRYALRLTGEQHTVYQLEDGSSKVIHPKGFELAKAFTALREAMYQPGKGTWFTAELTLTREGRFSVDFDYDLEPDRRGPLAPGPPSYAAAARRRRGAGGPGAGDRARAASRPARAVRAGGRGGWQRRAVLQPLHASCRAGCAGVPPGAQPAAGGG